MTELFHIPNATRPLNNHKAYLDLLHKNKIQTVSTNLTELIRVHMNKKILNKHT